MLLLSLNGASIEGDERINAGLSYDIQVCCSPGNCVTEATKLVVDYIPGQDAPIRETATVYLVISNILKLA